MQRILLKEYGDPVYLRMDPYELSLFEESNKYWKSKLQLPRYPFRTQQIDKDLFEVRAEGVTGIIKIGSFDFEIKPKFIGNSDKWQIVLWKILSLVDRGALDKNFTSAKDNNDYSLLELLVDVFLNSFAKGSIRGLPLGYNTHSAKGFELKGTFDQSRIVEWVNQPWELPYLVDNLSEDTLLTRLLRWTTLQLMTLTSSATQLKSLQAVLIRLGKISIIKPSIVEVRKIKLGVQYKELEQALSIGLILLENSGLGYGQSKKLISGFLWNSDKIYEKFVFLICSKAAKKLQLQTSKDSYKYGTVISDSGPSLETIPDIVFENREDKKIAVADAKYKVYKSRPNSADVYQILAACHVLGVKRGSLIYPVYEDKNYVTWNIESKIGGEDITLTMLPLNLMALEVENGLMKLIDSIASWVTHKESVNN